MLEVLDSKDLLINKLSVLLRDQKSFCLDPICLKLPSDIRIEIDSFKQHIWISSSGSYKKKLIALSHQSLQASAKAVNEWLKITPEDCWALTLPLNHIGGLSILSRAIEGKFKVVHFQERWDAFKFCNFIVREKCTISSLVPTQLFDLVSRELQSPPYLRAVLVGGAQLSSSIYQKSRELGWPILPSYGLTECSSQVATAPIESLDKNCDSVPLIVLPHLKCTIDDDRALMIKGTSLLSAYLKIDQQNNADLYNTDSTQFFKTEDLASIGHTDAQTIINIIGRLDRQIKIKGWLISLDQLEEKISLYFKDKALQPIFAITAVDDLRDGFRLVLNISSGSSVPTLLNDINHYLLSCDLHYPKISEIIEYSEVPLLPNGKINYNALSINKS